MKRRARSKKSSTPEELDSAAQRGLLRAHHPDYQRTGKRLLASGANRGEPAPSELANVLEAPGVIDHALVDLRRPDIEVDVLVLGAGGAGAAAAICASEAGASVLLCTKLRFGDSNTVMATGMACALARDDSPVLHFLDTMEGSGFTNVPELAAALTADGPEVIAWLREQGANLTVPEWGKRWTHASRVRDKVVGHSVQRGVQAYGGITGLEITRALKEEILARKIPVREFHPAVELVLDDRRGCAGAVLRNTDTGRPVVVRAGATILATGGIGRLHCGGFPTSNHYGATGDGLVIGYRAGAKLRDQDSVQYHPTGIVWPDAALGWVLTEGLRSGGGATLTNAAGKRFINEVHTRDVVTAAILRECAEGRGVAAPNGRQGVWLDARAVKLAAFTETRLRKLGIDLARKPVLVYPCLHYHNGGLLIDASGQTTVPYLYAAGEVAGGVHGRNRLGGNSLLDIIVFGRRAGRHAAQVAARVKHRGLRLPRARHVRGQRPAPIVYPDYSGARGTVGLE